MKLSSKTNKTLRVAWKISGPVRFLSNAEIKSQIERAQRGDLPAFDRVFVNFLPHICRTAQAAGLRGLDLLNMIGKAENRLKEALVHSPIFGRVDCRYYRILIKDFIKEEIIKSEKEEGYYQFTLGDIKLKERMVLSRFFPGKDFKSGAGNLREAERFL